MASLPDNEHDGSAREVESTSEEKDEEFNRQSLCSPSEINHDTQAESDLNSTLPINSKLDNSNMTGLKLANTSRLHGKRRRNESPAVSTKANIPYRSLRHAKKRRSSPAPPKASETAKESISSIKADVTKEEDERIGFQNDLLTPSVRASPNHQNLHTGNMSHGKRAEVVDWLTVIDDDLYTPTAGTINGLPKDHPRVLKEVFDEIELHQDSSDESSVHDNPPTMFGYFL